MKRVAKTVLIVWFYCIVWQITELILYGGIEHRVVDDIMMLVFTPVIYKALK